MEVGLRAACQRLHADTGGVEVHGGRIWVESVPPEGGKWKEGAGRGSTFCFTLPVPVPVPARCP